MSACKCGERERPFLSDLPTGSNDRPRQWYVVRRHVSRSAFNGYRERYSRFCSVYCAVCGAYWRTAADFPTHLPDAPDLPAPLPKAEPWLP